MGGFLSRGLGSESSAWAALMVLAAVQLSFHLMPPRHDWTAVLFTALSGCLCVLAIGIASSSLESMPKRAVAIIGAVLLLGFSLSHLFGTRAPPAVDIAEPVPGPTAPVTVAEPTGTAGGAQPAVDHRVIEVKPTNIRSFAPGVAVESRIDLVDGVYRLSWRVSRDGTARRCGPVFFRGARTDAEAMLQARIEASVARTGLGAPACD